MAAKKEIPRFYYEREYGSYLCVFPDLTHPQGLMEGAVNVYPGKSPSLCWGSASPEYLIKECKRVYWTDLPNEWQDAFTQYLTPESLSRAKQYQR